MSLIEVIAVFFSFVSVITTIQKRLSSWIWDIIGNTGYLILFIQQGFFCESILQVIFNAQCLAGLYLWHRNNRELQVTALPKKKFIRDIIVTLIITLIIYLFLIKYFHSTQPFLDVITTTLSLLANYYLTKKIYQSWYIWITVDFIFILLFAKQELYLSLGLYIIFLVLAYKGLQTWKRDLKKV